MVVEALLSPIWEVVRDVFTSFVYCPANYVEHLDAAASNYSAWKKATNAMVNLSRCKEHHRMAFP